MRRKVIIAIMIIVCFLLQSTIYKALALATVSPTLLLELPASFGMLRANKDALIVGFFSGLLIDLLFGSVIGFYALIYMVIGFCNGFFKQSFFPDEIRLPIILIALSDFFSNLLVYFFLFWFRGRFAFGYYLLHTILPELVYTMIVAILLYFIFLKINQKLEDIERRSEKKFV